MTQTRGEIEMQHRFADKLERIAKALERIADALEGKQPPPPAPRSTP